MDNRPSLFLYWENRKGSRRPPYMDMCFDTIKAHLYQDFRVVVLSPDNLYGYVPEIHEKWHSLKVLAHKADIIRIAALYYNGGFWLDFDTIAMRPAPHWLRKFEEADLVWGSEQCFGARKGSPLLADVLALQYSKLDEDREDYDWAELGLTGSIGPVMNRYKEEGRLDKWDIPLEEISTTPPLGWERDSGTEGFMGMASIEGFFNPKQVVVRLHNQLYSKYVKQMDVYQHAVSGTLFSQFVHRSLHNAQCDTVWKKYLRQKTRSVLRRGSRCLLQTLKRSE